MKFLTRPEWTVLAVLLLATVLGPILGDPFLVSLQGYTAAFAVFALSIYLVVAWIGEIPLGHSLYFGLGAYGSAILMRDFGASFITAAIGAMAIAAVLAGLIGLVTLRLKGAYFAIVSWGVASVAVVIVNSWTPVTGGALGFYGTPTAEVAGLSMRNSRDYAWVTGAILVLLIVALAAMRRTNFGRRLNGGRVNNNLIRAAGAHIYLDRVIAFTVSAGLAALAGALSVSYVRVLTPNMLGFTITIDALVMVLLGGTGFLLGPVIGAALIRIIPEQLHVSPEARTMIVAALILAIVLLAPGGIPDIIRRLKGIWRRRKEPASDPKEPAEMKRQVEEVKQ